MKKPMVAVLAVLIMITVFLAQYSRAQSVEEQHDYVIIEAPTAAALAVNVNKYLQKGYTPAGGFVMQSGKFLQALYK